MLVKIFDTLNRIYPTVWRLTGHLCVWVGFWNAFHNRYEAAAYHAAMAVLFFMWSQE